MPVQIGKKPDSDFRNPLGLLSDCHRRIERFLEVLIRISESRQGGELQAEERRSLETALEYFRNSAPKHTSDEEDSLFPRLRASGGAQAALECLEKIEGDHQAAAGDHEIVDGLARRWLQDGKLESRPAAELGQALSRLAQLYNRHIAIEDRELFPLAARLLEAEQLAAVGREMAERRGIAPDAGMRKRL